MKNLKDYILHLDNWIPQNILDKSLKELKKDKTWIQHKYHTADNPWQAIPLGWLSIS